MTAEEVHNIPWQLLWDYARQGDFQPVAEAGGRQLSLLSMDQGHSGLSGNKLYKLFGNLVLARQRQQVLLSMGGAWSNHLHALAYAGYRLGIPTIGLVKTFRDHSPTLTATLQDCKDWGMTLKPLSATHFRACRDKRFLNEYVATQFPGIDLLVVPEGGSNVLALEGMRIYAQVVQEQCRKQGISRLCLPCGTGGTVAGLALGCSGETELLGLSMIGATASVYRNITDLLTAADKLQSLATIHIHHDTSFGRFGSLSPSQKMQMLQLESQWGVSFDPVYTGKMAMYLDEHVLRQPPGPPQHVGMIHTGGLQGRRGYGLSYESGRPCEAKEQLFSTMEAL